MTGPHPHAVYRDVEGRQFVLDHRVDPVGPTPAYWTVTHLGTGRHTTIREDRLIHDYVPVEETP